MRELVAVFFPDLCAACQKPLFKGEETVCTSCLSALPYTDYHLYADNPVEKLFWGRTEIHTGVALFHFHKGNRVQNMLHELKYRGNKHVGLLMGRMMGSRLKEEQRIGHVDYVVPIPLHAKKMKTRGYNQSSLIARGIGESTGWNVHEELVVRPVNNPTQTKKTRFERFQNVEGVFALRDFNPNGPAHVLLVDDVVTTGSTLESCIRLFDGMKDVKVSVCVMAYAE